MVPASAMIKNVKSVSAQFLATFTTPQRSRPPLSAVYLMGVNHAPDIPPDASLRPAIVWAGTARVHSRLILSGCRFVRPRPIPRAGDHVEPVQINLLDGVATEPVLRGVIDDFSEAGSARGHVFDLGNQIERPGSTALVTLVSGSRLFDGAGTLRDRFVRLPVLDRFEQVTVEIR